MVWVFPPKFMLNFFTIWGYIHRGFILTIQIGLHCIMVRSLPPSSPQTPFPAPLKAIARGFAVLFRICIWSPFLHSLSPTHTYPPTLYLFLQPCLSLIPKSMFKGVSRCIPAMSILYFSQFNPNILSSHPPLFNSFQYILLYLLPAQMLCILI
jgi:hypothetical protein